MAQVSPCGAVAAGSHAAAATGIHRATGRKTAADRGTAAAATTAADQEVPQSHHLLAVAPREVQC